MRRRLAASVMAMALCACGSSAAHSTTTPSAPASGTGTPTTALPPSAPVCGPGSAQTLAADRSARVYALNGKVLGCAKGSQRSWTLGSRGLSVTLPRVGPVALHGSVAAYGAQAHGVDTARAQVIVRRLGDGKILAQQPATTTPQGPEAFVSVTALVLAPDDDVAWISSGESILSHRGTLEVHALDSHGARRLDSGTTISPTQLRLNASTVRWKHGGAWRSAVLA